MPSRTRRKTPSARAGSTQRVLFDGRVVGTRAAKGSHCWKPREPEWAVKGILDQDYGAGKFLVDWYGVDPATGRPWVPTWESYWRLRTAPDVVLAWSTHKALSDEWQDRLDTPPPPRARRRAPAHPPAAETHAPQPVVVSDDDSSSDSDSGGASLLLYPVGHGY
jgi:hypothetical protein